MSEFGSESNDDNQESPNPEINQILEKNLQRMESILQQSAMGIHILFENDSLKSVLSQKVDDKDFFDFDKMKRVQDVMTELISKRSYVEQMAYLQDLDKESYSMLVRTYFHLVENTVRSTHDLSH